MMKENNVDVKLVRVDGEQLAIGVETLFDLLNMHSSYMYSDSTIENGKLETHHLAIVSLWPSNDRLIGSPASRRATSNVLFMCLSSTWYFAGVVNGMAC